MSCPWFFIFLCGRLHTGDHSYSCEMEGNDHLHLLLPWYRVLYLVGPITKDVGLLTNFSTSPKGEGCGFVFWPSLPCLLKSYPYYSNPRKFTETRSWGMEKARYSTYHLASSSCFLMKSWNYMKLCDALNAENQ